MILAILELYDKYGGKWPIVSYNWPVLSDIW